MWDLAIVVHSRTIISRVQSHHTKKKKKYDKYLINSEIDAVTLLEYISISLSLSRKIYELIMRIENKIKTRIFNQTKIDVDLSLMRCKLSESLLPRQKSNGTV